MSNEPPLATPQGGGRALSTGRVVSSIPRARVPAIDSTAFNGGRWIYPSQQMFYDAMRRKGWDADRAAIPAVVAIHNAVNERAWHHVVQWELGMHASLYVGDDRPLGPRLVGFHGRSGDVSPKARLCSWLGWSLPFDRHDWYVDRQDGNGEVRYVVDFYRGDNGCATGGRGGDCPVAGGEGAEDVPIPSFYLDVRPALDSLTALVDRLRRLAWS